MIRVLMALAVMASSTNSVVPATGAAAASGPEPRAIADKAMQYVAAEDLKGMFDYIGRNMPMERSELISIRDGIIEQRKKLGSALGKPLGFVFIGECRRAEILVRLIYAEKHEKQVMRWEFIFYRPRNTWIMTFFHWDMELQKLFEPCR
jgi:hypothetical protein